MTKAQAALKPLEKEFVPGKAQPEAQPKGANTEYRFKQLSEVEEKPILYLEKPLLLANAFQLLVGKKGVNKSTFLCHVAARFSRGEFGDKRNVVWIATEDSLEQDVRPRIRVAGGDLTRITVLDKDFGIPRLPWCVDLLRDTLTAHNPAGLLVLDATSDMIGRGKNSNSDLDIREALQPLNTLADQMQCLICGVRHVNKNVSEFDALSAVTGSAAWTQVPRATICIAVDDEDCDLRHVQVIAGNRLPPGSAGILYRVLGVKALSNGEEVTMMKQIGSSNKDINTLYKAEAKNESSNTKLAMIALLDEAEAAGETGVLAKDTTQNVARQYELAAGTVNNAKTRLKNDGLIEFFKSGMTGNWFFRRTAKPRPENLSDRTSHELH